MRTLQIGDLWLPEQEGGLARYYFELLRHLPQTGTSSVGLVISSENVCTASKGSVFSFAKANESLPRRMLKLRAAALAQLRFQNVDLVASHFAPYALPILDRLRSIPLVVHFHGPWAAESATEGKQSRTKAAIERIVYRRAHRLIVLSKCFQQEAVRRYKLPEESVRIVPGGIDVDRFNVALSRPEARAQLGWPLDRPIILCVRRQVRRMGLEELIDAARLLAALCPDVLFLLGGSGPLTPELQMRIAEYGIERNVRLLGRIPDHQLPMAYRAADISVVPSTALEGFGLITLESLASGTPVYVTPVGGLPEIISPFAPDCVFSDTSPAEISNVLYESLRGGRPQPSQEACRKYAVENFSWPTIASRVRRIYDEALA